MGDHDEPDDKRQLGFAPSDPLGHLMLRDRRTPEGKATAEAKERARRRGRGRNTWMLRTPEKG